MDETIRFLELHAVQNLAPGEAVLANIARAFSALPYENVTKILKQARSNSARASLRDAGEVLGDHLRWGTGGTCFSLCNALSKLLAGASFDAFIAMADMHYGQDIHCAVVVRLDGSRFLLDPGYLLHQPIRFPGPGGSTRIRTAMNETSLVWESDNLFSLYTTELSQTKWRYRLKAFPVSDQEFIDHWIHSFSLNTMEHLMLSRCDANGRTYFRKGSLEQVAHQTKQKSRLDNGCSGELAGIFGVPADMIRLAQNALVTRTITPVLHG
jgi:arylamine N-acetyltransferase